MTVCREIANALMAHDVTTAFGLPGIHNLPIYSAFCDAGFRLVTVRHEQSASFMADGYARASGRTAACIVIDGPGFLNAATGIAQARADSIPMVVVTPGSEKSGATGRAHELCGQGKIARQLCRDHVLMDDRTEPSDIGAFLDRDRFRNRLGPIHIEIVMSSLDETIGNHSQWDASVRYAVEATGDFDKANQLLSASEAPIIVAGGGSIEAQSEIRTLAERLDAPLVNTVNAKGILPLGHSLRVGYSPSLPEIRSALSDSDVVLVVGSELGETDFDFLMLDEPLRFQQLIRIDRDPQQLNCNAEPCCAIVGSVDSALEQLAVSKANRNGAVRTSDMRESSRRSQYCNSEMGEFLDTIRNETDVLVGDSTQPTYYAIWMYEPHDTRQYFHSVSGFGTLGYAIPATIGAKLAVPDRRVTCLIGDGGAQFTLAEIRTAQQLGLGIPFVIWNNHGYMEIDKAMSVQTAEPWYESPTPPDFRLMAQAHGVCYSYPHDLAELAVAVRVAHVSNRPTLIEVDQSRFFNHESAENWYQ